MRMIDTFDRILQKANIIFMHHMPRTFNISALHAVCVILLTCSPDWRKSRLRSLKPPCPTMLLDRPSPDSRDFSPPCMPCFEQMSIVSSFENFRPHHDRPPSILSWLRVVVSGTLNLAAKRGHSICCPHVSTVMLWVAFEKSFCAPALGIRRRMMLTLHSALIFEPTVFQLQIFHRFNSFIYCLTHHCR